MSSIPFKTSNARASHIRNLFLWEPKPTWNRDTVVLITGGASGIGRQLARLYASRGACLGICDINQQALEETVKELRGISSRVMAPPSAFQNVDGVAKSTLVDISDEGKCIFASKVDVTKEVDCQNFVDLAAKLFGRIDIMILCAGIGAHNVFSNTNDLSIFHKCMNVNFYGYLNCTRAAHEYLLRSKGTLTAITSFSGEVGLPYRTAYCASKFAVTGFLESLRAEMQDLGGPKYDIVVVCPPTVSTNLRKNSLTTDEALKNAPADEDKSMTVEDCAACILDATDRRLRKAFFPLKSAVASYLRPLVPDIIDRKIWERSRL